MCHKGQPLRPYGLYVWGQTLEVCSNDSCKNLTNALVFETESQYCLNLRPRGTTYFVPKAFHPHKKAIVGAVEGNGGMYNVMAVIRSIFTTIKLKPKLG